MHPYKGKCTGDREAGRARYRAEGGAVDDAKAQLMDAMNYAQHEKAYDKNGEKHFWDSGTVVPGRQAGKNLEWERKNKIKTRMIKD